MTFDAFEISVSVVALLVIIAFIAAMAREER